MSYSLHFQLNKEVHSRVETPTEEEMTVVERFYMYKPHCRFIRLLKDGEKELEFRERDTFLRKKK